MIQNEIGTWHVEHFGSLGEEPALLRKLAEEVQEFLSCPCGDEAADICIVLYAWCHRYGVSLDAEIRDKFDIVKSRNQIERDRVKGIIQ